MKNWAFVSDFDGTISKKDFYWVVIEKYFPEGQELFRKWKAGEMKDIEFLSTVFSSIDQGEQQIIEDIWQIPIDSHIPEFIKMIQNNGGDFYILSAGTDYYIYHILEKYDIKGVTVLSNEGYYQDGNVHMNIDPGHRHFSERYGIDKSKVIQDLKEEYETVHFAGDSEPDSHPAVYADLTFAKDALKDILKEKNIPFIPVTAFEEVEAELQRKGFLPHD
ncbi:MtnX-like HAD-IB family phosphatase [Salimicrobium flavidum]|uniref:Haloacid Dehalogenase superfamily, subfamily IB, phosphoserine phosphatase-like/2,3-diketo-5-methylthio-1-phosphopentane phosphatase n=1 Tax=Salimicrobium flavidum TaxID=570947 RepID=A0A1N7J6Y8_9BACI|nr:MtnX-like HAD-IB family phosphatase [Salimicrobium flavidum]SIS45079.1 Haloacid Dehalogenase superfamily, subfamily IB, phosphoserine phosphatase-like/2,3-diketo-5-methylthio-1-phosphopentane phosphatase [Salimicrobium flavidum]